LSSSFLIGEEQASFAFQLKSISALTDSLKTGKKQKQYDPIRRKFTT
jgi:hypothetical protein